MMTVNEFSKRAAVAPHVVRYYARIGLLEPVRHPENGYKLFSHADAVRLRFIRNAQRLGYTLEEIRRLLAVSSKGKSVCQEARALLQRHLADNRIKLEELTTLQQRMERALRLWDQLPDGDPNDAHVCHLIENPTLTLNA